ncbi:S-methyl-5-thioribose-1-phosphate isomerase [Streptomyces sp. ISL-100]|uniref:S-methyl-5-thioribose-1-phosphate isomerase n=1 Tax=Streptomyces sp. ISL-100 TaxID=2819173 RepID=UPI002034ADDA|nr:S-methyl-5-thioribose-1-phosphate isomerase [Streptomyces sp. ISL-100]
MPPAEPSLRWDGDAIVTLDQRALPHERRILRLTTVDDVIAAIATLAVRGAPAIGLAGAMGVALSAFKHCRPGAAGHCADAVRLDAQRLIAARPTAVNLAWAVHRALGRVPEGAHAVLQEATAMLQEDITANRTMVGHAVATVLAHTPDRPLRVLTHCNTGRLATAAVGTALGTIIALAEAGRIAEVLVGETRPLLQGARLTAWELAEAGVPHRLCIDSAPAAAMSQGLVDCVLVGADRIAANGDVANKIGTYSLAVAAAHHRIPFVVVAPESSWDRSLPDGSAIVIEERDDDEVTGFGGVKTAPPGTRAYNPAFDVTPADLITAVVSEHGVHRHER